MQVFVGVISVKTVSRTEFSLHGLQLSDSDGGGWGADGGGWGTARSRNSTVSSLGLDF